MSTLHMETDVVRAMINQVIKAIENIHIQSQSLNISAQSANWVGPSREEFVAETEGIVRLLEAHAEAGTALAKRAEAEVIQWEEIASTSGGNSSSIFKIGPVPLLGGSSIPPWISPEPHIPPNFVPGDPGFDLPSNPSPSFPFPPGFHTDPGITPPFNPGVIDPGFTVKPNLPSLNPNIPDPIDLDLKVKIQPFIPTPSPSFKKVEPEIILNDRGTPIQIDPDFNLRPDLPAQNPNNKLGE